MISKQYARIAIFACIALVLSGCSIINPKKTTSLQRLGVWQYESERLAKNQNASEQKYNKARDEIRAFLDVTLDAEINDVASRPFGKIDLTLERIPKTVTSSVDDFKTSAGGVIPIKATEVEEIIKAILDWSYDKAKESRKASADELKKKLKELQWKQWSAVHKQ